MAKKCPFYCQNMVLTWSLQLGFSWILIIVPSDVTSQISQCWVYPVAPFPRNGQNLALLWPKHGPHMILLIGSSWILIIVPSDAPCRISLCWVNPVSPFPRYGQIGPFMAKTWPSHGPSNWISLNLNHCEQGCPMPNFILLHLSCSPLS